MVNNFKSLSKSYKCPQDLYHISHIQFIMPSIRGFSSFIPFRGGIYFHHILRITIKTYTENINNSEIEPISMISWIDEGVKDITTFVRRKIK